MNKYDAKKEKCIKILKTEIEKVMRAFEFFWDGLCI